MNAYCLHIAEDDGEVDTDFPPLDSNEPIHKFGFSTLALVEKFSSPGLACRQSLFVRMLVCFYFLTKLKTKLLARVSKRSVNTVASKRSLHMEKIKPSSCVPLMNQQSD